MSPKNILRIEPLWLLAKLAESTSDVSFIQIGANDGVRCDPIKAYIAKYGWKGVLVEPDPCHFASLIRNYDSIGGLQFLNLAIGEGSEAEFYSISRDAPDYPDWAFGIGSLDKYSILRHADVLPSVERFIEVSTVGVIDINSVAMRYLDGNIDLLVIDVEGRDADIIQSINTSVWRPKAIFYECMHLNRARHEELLAWLVRNGYSVHVGCQDSFAILPPFMTDSQAMTSR